LACWSNKLTKSHLNVLRPISRKYDKAEHAYPKEFDMLASLLDGMNEGAPGSAGATSARLVAQTVMQVALKTALICPPHWALWKCAGAMLAYC
jgi:hypothetical protein